KSECQLTGEYKSGNVKILAPLSGTWPAIGAIAGSMYAPCFFWIDNTNTLAYLDPEGREGRIENNGKSQEKLGDPVAAQNRDGDMEVFWISNNDTRELYQVKFKINVTG